MTRSRHGRAAKAVLGLTVLGLALGACGDDSGTSAASSTAAASASGATASGTSASGSAASGVNTPSTDPVLTAAYVGLATAFKDPVQDEFESYIGDGEYLLRPVPGGTEPWLAEKVDMVDTSTWKITMRAGLKYQNGTPVTIAKVKSWLDHELVTSSEFGEKYKGATVTVDGDRTLTVKFASPQAGFMNELSNYTLQFYDWDIVQTVGQDFNKLAGLGVYTGPYQITSVTPTKWTYTANPNYWKGKPALEKVEFLKVDDAQAAVKAVQAGEADIYIFADIAMQPTVAAIKSLHFNPGASAEYEALLPNLNKAPWNDPIVRQALAMTIDAKNISQKGTFGVFPPIAGLFPSKSEFALDWVKLDVAGANKLLDDNGWVKGGDGVRAKNGVRLAGELLSYNPQLSSISIPLAEGAKAAGFDLTPKKLDSAVWRTAIKDGAFDLTMQNNENFGINGDIAGACTKYFWSEATGATKGAGLDPEIKAACDKLTSTRDASTVKSVLKTVQERNAKMAYVIPVTERVSSWVTNDTWKSAAPDAFYIPVTWQTKAG